MIRPIGTNVIVLPDAQRKETDSGILVYKEDKEIEQWGTVHSVGNDVDMIGAGDYVMYERFSGSLVKMDDKDYLIMDQSDIVAVQEQL